MAKSRVLFCVLLVAVIAAAAWPACSARKSEPAAPSRAARSGEAASRVPTPFSCVTLKGELGARFAAAAANVITRRDRYSLASYKANATATEGALWPDWPGDQFGRMFSVMRVAEGYGWTQAPVLRKAVGDVVLPCQTQFGNFGPEVPPTHKDAKIISGNAFGLRGLMDAYADTRDARYLDAARRLGHYYEAAFDSWKDNGKGMLHEYYGHCIDGLVRLSELGGDSWALELAKKAAALTGRTEHTHHSLSMYRGVVDLFLATGDHALLDRAEDYLRWCRENRLADGALPEAMPKSEEDEGCALSDYVVVNLLMFRATGKDAYLEDAEHTLVNHFFMNQFHTGGFGHRRYGTDVVGGKQWQGWGGQFGSENPGCCSMWGMWGLGQVGPYIVTRDAGAIDINLYPSASIDLPDLGARLEISGDFPRMSRTEIAWHSDKPIRSAIRLRVPKWAEGVTAELNGSAVSNAIIDGRIVLDREWHSGDRIALKFARSLRLVPWPDASAAMFAVYDGPLCLALSSADADVDAVRFIQVTAAGGLALASSGRPQACDAKGAVTTALEPVAADWLSPNAKSPNNLRILFTKIVK